MTSTKLSTNKIWYSTVAIVVLLATFLLPQLLDAWQAEGYVADRRYSAHIVAINDIPRRSTRFAMIEGLAGRKIWLTDPRFNFRRCQVGDLIEYRMELGIKVRDKFVYIGQSCLRFRR